MGLSSVKDIASVIQSLATVIALLAGAWWFWTQRKTAVHPRLEQKIVSYQDVATPDRVMLVLEVKVSNIGNTSFELRQGTLRLAQISNVPKVLFDSQTEEAELDPGESTQIFLHVFYLRSDVGVVEVETHVPGSDYELDARSFYKVDPANKKSD